MKFTRVILIALCVGCGASPAPDPPPARTAAPARSERILPSDTPRLAADVARLQETLRARAGAGPYIVIDTVHNRLEVRQADSVALSTVVATGSGKVLLGDKAREAWNFTTPRRVFHVEKKVRDPIWKKPVWAFVEKNQDAPVLPWEFSRFDRTTLGKYALELQDSYAIHGTLYPGLLGRHITHGCVRLNDADLEAAFSAAEIGTPVYVY